MNFFFLQITTTPKNVHVISQEDFAKLRSNVRRTSTGETVTTVMAAAPAPPAVTMTPQNTPAVAGSMKVPPPVRMEELEGMDFELEEDMKKRDTAPSVDVPRTPKNNGATPKRGPPGSASKAPKGLNTPRFYPVTKETRGPIPQDVPRKRKTRHSQVLHFCTSQDFSIDPTL